MDVKSLKSFKSAKFGGGESEGIVSPRFPSEKHTAIILESASNEKERGINKSSEKIR
jgi:hypothetical protein